MPSRKIEKQEKTPEPVVMFKGGERRRNDKAGDIIFALLLIFAGGMFLANNLGIIPWEIWTELWRYWPVLLILWGLRIVLGKSNGSRLLLGFLAFLAFVLILGNGLKTVGSPVIHYLPGF